MRSPIRSLAPSGGFSFYTYFFFFFLPFSSLLYYCEGYYFFVYYCFLIFFYETYYFIDFKSELEDDGICEISPVKLFFYVFNLLLFEDVELFKFEIELLLF